MSALSRAIKFNSNLLGVRVRNADPDRPMPGPSLRTDYIRISGDGAQAWIDVLNAPGNSNVHPAGRTPLVPWRTKDELASGPIDSPFTGSGSCLQTQGLGANAEGVHAFTLRHFRSPTGSQREIFPSEYRSRESSSVSLS